MIIFDTVKLYTKGVCPDQFWVCPDQFPKNNNKIANKENLFLYIKQNKFQNILLLQNVKVEKTALLVLQIFSSYMY